VVWKNLKKNNDSRALKKGWRIDATSAHVSVSFRSSMLDNSRRCHSWIRSFIVTVSWQQPRIGGRYDEHFDHRFAVKKRLEPEARITRLTQALREVATARTLLNHILLDLGPQRMVLPNIARTRAAESEVPSSDSDSGKFRLSDSNSDSGPTPTFSCIS